MNQEQLEFIERALQYLSRIHDENRIYQRKMICSEYMCGEMDNFFADFSFLRPEDIALAVITLRSMNGYGTNWSHLVEADIPRGSIKISGISRFIEVKSCFNEDGKFSGRGFCINEDVLEEIRLEYDDLLWFTLTPECDFILPAGTILKIEVDIPCVYHGFRYAKWDRGSSMFNSATQLIERKYVKRIRIDRTSYIHD